MSKAVKQSQGFSEEERAAMKSRATEILNEGKDGDVQVQAAIAKLPEPDRSLAKKFYALVKKAAPSLLSRTWYGFPAFTNAKGQIITFFQYASKFKTRYSTVGFSDKAKLDDGEFWPVTFAVTEFTPAVEKKLIALVQQAIG